jgi:GWxTD domain-containing protein
MEQGDFFWIYARLNFKQPVEDSLWISYQWQSDELLYRDSVLFNSPNRRQLRLKWEFESNNVPPKITVSFSWKARDWFYQEHFPINAMHPTGGISFWKSRIPWFEEWMQLEDNILVENNSSDVTYVYYYGHQFEPSRPPMAMKPGAGSSLNIDSVFTLTPGQYFSPATTGLYFFQSDSSTTEGRSLLVTEGNFPEPQKIKELTEPLVYITTRGEFQQLKKDLTDKQALDKFWLSTLGSPDKARSAISRFYQNVEVANTLFSSYKKGWKTDRGMIFTVLGAPLMVNKDRTTEIWVYNDVSGEELYFTFRKISNIFSNNHYELIRDKSYDRDWFLAIDRWREGRIK